MKLFLLIRFFSDNELERIKKLVKSLGLNAYLNETGIYWIIEGIDGDSIADKKAFFELAGVEF